MEFQHTLNAHENKYIEYEKKKTIATVALMPSFIRNDYAVKNSGRYDKSKALNNFVVLRKVQFFF